MKLHYFLIAGSAVGLFLAGFFIFAQTDDPFAQITYPVAELGNCASRTNCEAYCQKPENMPSCLDFAEENDLVPKEDIAIARQMLELGETEGPGGCQGQAECEAYCNDMSHIKECVAFAEKHNLMPEEELKEAKKVVAALDRGVAPPPCNSKSECDKVCKKPENMRSCIIFAKEAGLMPPEEEAEAEKVLAAIEKGVAPPPCGRKEECDEYCSAPENLEQCLTFAEAAGFISQEEATMARKTGGKGPGGCKGKEQCETYCEDPSHGEECINFALENGFMDPEESEQAKKMLAAGMNMMKGGPGGCKGKEQCETYCNDVSHMTECVDFAEKAGMMSAEDAARARKMAEMGMTGGPGNCKGEEECRSFCETPDNAEECLDFAMKIGEMTPEEADQARQGMEMMQRGGPGGCKNEEDCQDYCQDPSHGEECLNFSIEMGMMEPEEAEEMRERMEEAKEMMEGGGFKGMAPEGTSPEDFEEMMPEGVSLEQMEQMREEIMEGITPEGMTEPPSQEQIQGMIQEQMQLQMEQQIQEQTRQQMEQMMPPSGEIPPQSFWQKTKNFLASLLSVFGF